MTHTGTVSEPKYSIVATSLEQVANGLWFPSKGHHIDLSDNLTNTYKATKIVVNQGLTDKYFDIEFPPGTRITNEISGLSYVSEAHEGQTCTSMNNEDKMPQPPTEQRKLNRTIIYISITTVIILLTALIVRKHV